MKKTPFVFGGAIVAGLLLGILSTGANHPTPIPQAEHLSDSSTAGNDALTLNTESGLIGAALTALTARPDLQGLARLGEVLPLLDGEAIRELLDRLERSSPGAASLQLEWLFSWLLSHDKEEATEWITPRLLAVAQDGPRGPLFPRSGLGKMFVAWAEAEPDVAIAFARKYPNYGISEQLLTAAVRKLAEGDATRGFAALLEFPRGRARTGALADVLTNWAKRDATAAFAAACRVEQGEGRDASLAAVLNEWAQADAASALTGYQSAGLNDAVVLAPVLARLIATDPARAVSVIEAMPATDFVRCSSRVAVAWAKHDPAAALTWAREHGLSLGKTVEVEHVVEHHSARRMYTMKESMIDSPLRSAFQAQPDATLAWLRSLPAGAERDQVYELAIPASPNAETALEFFAELPAEAAARAAYDIASRFARDPSVSRQWVESLPPGPVRQQAFAGLGTGASGVEPKLSEDRDAMLVGRLRSPNTYRIDLKEVIKISDPILRKDMFEMAFDNFRGTEEARARWIQKAMDEAGLSHEWKRQLIE